MIKDTQVPLCCVYTTKKKSDLLQSIKSGGNATYQIRTKMKTAAKILAACRERGIALPVVISNAAKCLDLVAHGVLTTMDVGDNGTTYTVDKLQRILGDRKLNELRLLSTGKNISENFIRPYALCFRPDFIDQLIQS